MILIREQNYNDILNVIGSKVNFYIIKYRLDPNSHLFLGTDLDFEIERISLYVLNKAISIRSRFNQGFIIDEVLYTIIGSDDYELNKKNVITTWNKMMAENNFIYGVNE